MPDKDAMEIGALFRKGKAMFGNAAPTAGR